VIKAREADQDLRCHEGRGTTFSFEVEPGRVTGFVGPNGARQVHHHADDPRAWDRPSGGGRHDRRAPTTATGCGRCSTSARCWTRRPCRAAAGAGRTTSRRSPAVTASGAVGSAWCWPRVGLQSVARKRIGGFSPRHETTPGYRGGAAGRSGGAHLRRGPSTASIPKASDGCVVSSAGSAAEGRTVLVSSHLMGEMALTADDGHRHRSRPVDRGRRRSPGSSRRLVPGMFSCAPWVATPRSPERLHAPDVTVHRVGRTGCGSTDSTRPASGRSPPPGRHRPARTAPPSRPRLETRSIAMTEGFRRLPKGDTVTTLLSTAPTPSDPPPPDRAGRAAAPVRPRRRT